MADNRRIRTAGRPTYGRPVAPRPRVRRSFRPRIGLIPRRILLLVVAAVVIIFALHKAFAIRTVTVIPTTGPPTLTAEVHKVLDTGLFQGNTLTFNAGAFRSKLMALDPTVKTVSATRVWPRSLRVVVTLNQPDLGWLTGNQSYQLDGDGTIIGPLTAGQTLPVVVDDSNLPVATGQSVVAAWFVAFAQSVNASLPATGLTPTKYEVKDTTFDLYVTTNRGYQLILDTSRPAAGEIADLKTVLTNLKQTNKTPAQYIDLRIAGRAYYK